MVRHAGGFSYLASRRPLGYDQLSGHKATLQICVKENLHGQPIILEWGPMAIDSPGTGTPLFRRVADALADAIGRGDYPVGTRLPPEFTLSRMFGASRFTIHEALVGLVLMHGAPKSYSRGSGSNGTESSI